jgi:uncharacterized membrane protein
MTRRELSRQERDELRQEALAELGCILIPCLAAAAIIALAFVFAYAIRWVRT